MSKTKHSGYHHEVPEWVCRNTQCNAKYTNDKPFRVAFGGLCGMCRENLPLLREALKTSLDEPVDARAHNPSNYSNFLKRFFCKRCQRLVVTPYYRHIKEGYWFCKECASKKGHVIQALDFSDEEKRMAEASAEKLLDKPLQSVGRET